MTSKTNFEKEASNLLKGELKKRGYTYEQLKEALDDIGVRTKTINLNKNINLGKFPLSFFLACVVALEMQKFDFEELINKYRPSDSKKK